MHNRIRQVRNALKLSQRAFADRLGVTQVAVSGWENGRVTKYAVSLICQKLGVNSYWLENGVGEMFDKPRAHESWVEVMFDMYSQLSPERQTLWRELARTILAEEWRGKTVEQFARSITDTLTPERSDQSDFSISLDRNS